jgi:MarR-like DNA-binding transcriptional regulator SgrR of sgrS sRNA
VDYDALIHHIAFTSVHAWLVTDYHAGGSYQGELAESWQSSPDFKEWKFVLRPGMTFENGDPITTDNVIDSWIRVVRILNAKGSPPSVFVNLVGYADFPGKTQTISGMTHDDRSITLRYSKPMPKLLDDLAFGLYAVVHPSCFDRKTGQWLDKRKTIASGAYRVQEWDDQHLLLALRKDYPASLRHPRPLSRVEIRWDAQRPGSPDLVIAHSRSDLAAQGYSFYGGAESHIGYLRVQSWTDPASPLANRDFRRSLRDAFYEELEKQSVHPVRSFFPLAIKGVHEMPATADPTQASLPSAAKQARIRFCPFSASMPLAAEGSEAMKNAANRFGMRFEIADTKLKDLIAEWGPGAHRFKEEISGFGTSIDLDDPDGDIRFMIRSKEGVCLPDPTGKAVAATAQSPIDAQKVNEILWADAIIWPVVHYSQGLWTKPNLDTSLMNRQVNSIPLQLLGWKN